jgi:tetratricopeptide (TPR) repeat protein
LSVRQPWLGEARFLREYASELLQQGRRAEAAPFLQAYVTFCLKKESPDLSKEDLLAIGDLALKAGVPLPAAVGLSEWQAAHGALSTKERLLLGSMYYVGGKNKEAFEALSAAEAEMPEGRQHRWCLVAMFTALLRMERMDEAQALMERLETTYPGEPELDEARYRLGAHWFDRRELQKARACFESLRESTQSELYQEMCGEYVDRILHLEDVAKERPK